MEKRQQWLQYIQDSTLYAFFREELYRIIHSRGIARVYAWASMWVRVNGRGKGNSTHASFLLMSILEGFWSTRGSSFRDAQCFVLDPRGSFRASRIACVWSLNFYLMIFQPDLASWVLIKNFLLWFHRQLFISSLYQ